jgi:hypothetical protein
MIVTDKRQWVIEGVIKSRAIIGRRRLKIEKANVSRTNYVQRSGWPRTPWRLLASWSSLVHRLNGRHCGGGISGGNAYERAFGLRAGSIASTSKVYRA